MKIKFIGIIFIIYVNNAMNSCPSKFGVERDNLKCPYTNIPPFQVI